MTLVEARGADRVRSFLRARILFNNNNSTIDCTIKNISPTGAKIEMANTTTIPGEFTLDIPAKGQTLRARIMWRDAEAIGVQFIEAQVEREVSPADKTEKLEREIRKLKQLNATLVKRLEDLGQDVSLNNY